MSRPWPPSATSLAHRTAGGRPRECH
jgi:hypothetical protein